MVEGVVSFRVVCWCDNVGLKYASVLITHMSQHVTINFAAVSGGGGNGSMKAMRFVKNRFWSV